MFGEGVPRLDVGALAVACGDGDGDGSGEGVASAGSAGGCECDLYLTCAKFVTTPEYAPRLRTRRQVEETLALDAAESRNRVNLNTVITHWPDMLKVAGSLVTNQVRAYDLLRVFGRDGRPNPLGTAFAKYGRIAKTEHLLRPVDSVDTTYHRQMNRQLTVQESRHKLARDVCHGKRGTVHQAYRDGMEGQLGALGLVLDAIMLRTTKFIDAAVAQFRTEGHEIRDEDIARLSPLKHRNPNLLGRYSFTAGIPTAGALRPLRDPDTPELGEDDGGGDPA
ncbi:transposase [Streptomyces sp. NBC_01213]|nr:transposase [Streptomyces sp. NBC_01213]